MILTAAHNADEKMGKVNGLFLLRRLPNHSGLSLVGLPSTVLPQRIGCEVCATKSDNISGNVVRSCRMKSVAMDGDEVSAKPAFEMRWIAHQLLRRMLRD